MCASCYAVTQQEASYAGDPGGAPAEKLLVSITIRNCYVQWEAAIAPGEPRITNDRL